MALTGSGIYYPTNSDNVSIIEDFTNFANSVSDRINIVQVADSSTSTVVDTSSAGTFVSSGLNVNITPKFVDSKILVMATLPFSASFTTTGFGGMRVPTEFRLNVGSTPLVQQSSDFGGLGRGADGANILKESLNITFLHAHGSSTVLNYNISGCFPSWASTFTKLLRMNYAQAAAKSSIVALEVLV